MLHVAPDHIGGQLFAFFSRNLMASPTVRMVSAASSGISQPNSSSKAMTSSTVSRLSAPRSSMKLAFSVTLASSTPRCSTTIFLTRSATSLITFTSTAGLNAFLGVDGFGLTRASHPGSSRPSGVGSPAEGAVTYHSSLGFANRSAASACQLEAGRGRASDHRHSAIDMNGLAGDVAGLVAGEEDHARRNVLGRAQAAHRDGAGDPVFLLGRQRA